MFNTSTEEKIKTQKQSQLPHANTLHVLSELKSSDVFNDFVFKAKAKAKKYSRPTLRFFWVGAI